MVAEIRAQLLRFFGADPKEYELVFTRCVLLYLLHIVLCCSVHSAKHGLGAWQRALGAG